MKVAELFAALGFKIEGADKLDRVDRSLDSTARNAVKATAAVTVLTTGFLAMIDTSLRAAQALQNFALSTGLSSEDLQMWQHAAQVAGIGASDMTDAIKRLQTARTNFALGDPEAMGAWGWLGVQPTDQDPIRVIEKLRQKIAGISDVGIARNLLGRVGLENLLPLLRATDTEFEKWGKAFVIDQGQIARLTKLNREWQNLKVSLASVKTQFSSVFTPSLLAIGKLLQTVTEKVADFVKWLDKGSTGARIIKVVLNVLAAALLGVTAALIALSAALGLVTLLSWTSGFAPIILLLTTLAGLVVFLVLLFQDLWVAVQGGKSAFSWGAGLNKALEDAKALRDVLVSIVKVLDTFKTTSGVLLKGFGITSDQEHKERLFRPAISGSAVQGSNSQTNDIDIHVDGAQDPRETSRAVAGSLKGAIAFAYGQMPVNSV